MSNSPSNISNFSNFGSPCALKRRHRTREVCSPTRGSDCFPQCCRQSKLLKQLDTDRKENATTDFMVIVEKERFNVHKVVLATYSKYFKVMFTGNFVEKSCKFVELKEVPRKEFSWLIDYMYGEPLDLRDKKVFEIEKAIDIADMLCIDSYLDECKEEVRHWKNFNQFYVPYEIALKLGVNDVSSEIMTHLLRHTFLPIYRHFLSSFVRLHCLSRRLVEDFLDLIRSPNQETLDVIDQSKFNVAEKFMAGLSLVLKFISWSDLTEEEASALVKKSLIRELPFAEVGRCLMDTKEFHLPPRDWPMSFGTDDAERYLRNAFTAVNVVHEMAQNEINSLKLTIGATVVKGLTVKTTIYLGNDTQRYTLYSPFPVKQVLQVKSDLYLVGQKDIYQYSFATKDGVLKPIPESLTNSVEYLTASVCYFEDDLATYVFLGRDTENAKVKLAIFNYSGLCKKKELDLEMHGRMYATVKDGVVLYLMTNGRCYKYDLKTSVLELIAVLSAPIFGVAPLISHPMLMNGDNLYVFSKSNFCTVISLGEGRNKASRFMISNYVGAAPICACVKNNTVVVALTAPSFESEVQICVLEPNSKIFKCLGFVELLNSFDTHDDKAHHLLGVDFL